jgi:hypothetical protein
MASGSPLIVVALVKDLFFSVKLGNEVRRAGFEPRIVKTQSDFSDAVRADNVALGIIDLSVKVDWTNWQPPGVPVIAFGPHKDIEGRRAAKAAGIARILSNSQFHAEAPLYVQRYARRSIQPPPGLR